VVFVEKPAPVSLLEAFEDPNGLGFLRKRH
jgi:hypothetical protein